MDEEHEMSEKIADIEIENEQTIAVVEKELLETSVSITSQENQVTSLV